MGISATTIQVSGVRHHDAAWRRERDEALGALVAAHGQGVVRVLAGMVGDLQTAEDLAQDTFLRALERWHQLDDRGRARGWLYAIAVNAARQHLRRRRRWRLVPWAEADIAGSAADCAPADRHAGVPDVLAGLSTDDREVLLLVGVVGLTAAEAADALGIGVDATHKRWQRACRRFRREYGGPDDHAL